VRHFYPGTQDDFVATLASRDGTVLNAQAVAFSFTNGSTWLTATWQGSSGTKRKAKVTLTSGGNLPAPGIYDTVLARIGDPGPSFKIGSVQVH